jgi:flagellar motility protein MotE (MotC chaperone)
MKRLATLIGVFLLGGGHAGLAEDKEAAGRDSATAIIQDYCLDIRDKAAEARAAWQAETLKGLEAKLVMKIAELEAKRLEVQSWVERQEAILKSANAGLVEIYAKMDPEAAALQLSEVGRTTAVAILSQLSPRSASAIMNVMEPGRAAELVKALASPLAARKESRR